ncbi:bifunctional riboflavin kinase/FAD synthetase [Arthrobacter sp. MYb211]|uniref:bifunctional riboflavin kinase/FAD synthetase n=1 Tax=Micrococcaceae TaxID=1268 RepID=UPI000BB7A831|nr:MULTISPECIES: bifunctional riboflavin kinase/FAD synthetase [Micrococcaceae]PCC27722.1 riboflavin biosynthesis protein RibF [Glutamicibacter sp. BW80]PQZ96595.1 bifunctional riboflavin kinase/FAD synthetase [Arthrobacter sp. MYb224]PRA01993.1 bifunctional riboflavin kinase/FAD synthetase [Arthrobacter sp. MYb229]PRA13171.1 bifunctional riboflavin kinase/FAD synthetase [Arthrobacter sp. MYb221]PRB50502.1 bifunctional riboflavin kinase/FAD synthetase [Arthrobacter sp. MYb216]
MHYWKGLDSVPTDMAPAVVTIGNFDGVHLGHCEVLDSAVSHAKRRSAKSVAITFDPHPAQVHRPDSAPELIMGLEDRIDTLASVGLDATLMINYTLEFAEQSAEEFVHSIIVEKLNAVAVVVGHDVRFGHGNSGDFDFMRELGAKYGFDVIGVEDVGDKRRLSSTWVREELAAGNVEAAAAILGRPHRMRGEVVHGAARGRELGFPTANLAPEAAGIIPADGVYAGWVIDEAEVRWPAAISVGSNPTFDGVARVVEAHVIDRPVEGYEEFDLYGQQIVVEFISHLRPMVAYRGIEALIEQMNEDVVQARSVLATESH